VSCLFAYAQQPGELLLRANGKRMGMQASANEWVCIVGLQVGSNCTKVDEGREHKAWHQTWAANQLQCLIHRIVLFPSGLQDARKHVGLNVGAGSWVTWVPNLGLPAIL